LNSLSQKLFDEHPEIAEISSSRPSSVHPVWILAEQICMMMGREIGYANLIKCVDSCLMVNRPNGLANKRRVRADSGASTKTREARGIIFSDAVLDYLVHLHLLNSGSRGQRALSFRDFVQILKERYGFIVDMEPTGMTISNDLLLRNRMILERRLRDMGLLIGVNDAEAMKHIRGRFSPEESEHNAD